MDGEPKPASSPGERTDAQQAWALLTEEEKEVFGGALDALLWATRPRLGDFFFRKQRERRVLELASNALMGALGIGYGAGFRAVERFAALANDLEGADSDRRRQRLLEFLRRGGD